MDELITIIRWAVSFVMRGRPERTITRQQVVARDRIVPQDGTRDSPPAGRPDSTSVTNPVR